jgi:hypothetical protein
VSTALLPVHTANSVQTRKAKERTIQDHLQAKQQLLQSKEVTAKSHFDQQEQEFRQQVAQMESNARQQEASLNKRSEDVALWEKQVHGQETRLAELEPRMSKLESELSREQQRTSKLTIRAVQLEHELEESREASSRAYAALETERAASGRGLDNARMIVERKDAELQGVHAQAHAALEAAMAPMQVTLAEAMQRTNAAVVRARDLSMALEVDATRLAAKDLEVSHFRGLMDKFEAQSIGLQRENASLCEKLQSLDGELLRLNAIRTASGVHFDQTTEQNQHLSQQLRQASQQIEVYQHEAEKRSGGRAYNDLEADLVSEKQRVRYSSLSLLFSLILSHSLSFSLSLSLLFSSQSLLFSSLLFSFSFSSLLSLFSLILFSSLSFSLSLSFSSLSLLFLSHSLFSLILFSSHSLLSHFLLFSSLLSHSLSVCLSVSLSLSLSFLFSSSYTCASLRFSYGLHFSAMLQH